MIVATYRMVVTMAKDGEKPEWLRKEEKEREREKGKKKETKEEWEERIVREEKEEYARMGSRYGRMGEEELEDIMRCEMMEGSSDGGGGGSGWESEED